MDGFGKLAKAGLKQEFELQVLKSNAGFYLGTQTPEGFPASRESVEYWSTDGTANAALSSGEWTQRTVP